ncbi:MAG TPA: AbgT family transporter [Candidatus Lachnoclostridium avicola]|nr:AbgT family transporter [Candidatus Lachnoclostridium avicola]
MGKKEAGTKKKAFKMPHLLWIMLGLLLIASILTYIIPAGQFATDEAGNVLGDQFNYLGYQTPVNPWQMLMMIVDGFSGSAAVICTVLSMGAMTGVVLSTGAFDDILNYAIFKLKDKGEMVLISGLFILMVYLGSFGGSDALIAVVPIGVIFCKKMKLDPICAIGVTTYATLIGFGTGPTKQYITQLMMGVPMYGAFGTMFISQNFFMIVGLVFLLMYVKKIRKDPTKSLMWDEGWNPDAMEVNASDESKLGTDVKLPGRSVGIVLVFALQYVIIVAYSLSGGTNTQPVMVALAILVSIICGIIAGYSPDKLGDEFVKGLQSMVFVCFVIGLARVMSLVLTDGNILHTIVYVLTRPLMDLPRSVASIGMTAIISVINLVIPSATSKAAILVPIIQPIANTLGMDPNLAVQAFQYGDGFTNIVSPFLGWTIGSCAMAGVPYPKWLKWALPKVLGFIVLGFVIMFILTESGWTAF